MVRSFAQSLEDRATRMLQLSEILKNYADKNELKDRFEQKFQPKGISNTSDETKI